IVRFRCKGNFSIDLPHGQLVVLIDLRADHAFLAPPPPDVELLRAYGVRKIPRYTASAAQLAHDFLAGPAWDKVRDEGIRRVRERWPSLTLEQAARIFRGEPYIGMTEEQAEEAVGPLVLARDSGAGRDREMV